MLFLKTNPIGIDVKIQELQSDLYAFLLKRWNIEERLYYAYGRAYRNQTKDSLGYIPEVFKGGIEYGDPMLDDSKLVTSFFGTAQKESLSFSLATTNVHLIFCLNVARIKSLTHRGDEEIHGDVLKGLDNVSFGTLKIESLETGMDAVFREYSGYRAQQAMKFRDMHPYHCFRINFPLNYFPPNC